MGPCGDSSRRRQRRWPEAFRRSIGVAIKDEEDCIRRQASSMRSGEGLRVMKLPRAAALLVDFTRFLRAHGFPLAHEQVVMFLDAVRLLGPKSIESIRHAAHATLAPPPDRHAEFDALFHAFFFEEAAVASAARSLPEREAAVKDKDGGRLEPPEIEGANRSGKAATAREILGVRHFDDRSQDPATNALRRKGPDALPRRLGFRRIPDRRGDTLDLRRSLRRMVAHDGDVIKLMRGRRKSMHRRVVLLIDISGSMKAQTADYLIYAHALTRDGRQRRDLHLRHAAHPHHPRAQASRPGARPCRAWRRWSTTGTAARASDRP